MTELGKEYGNGLYELARDERLLDQIHDELTQIGELMAQQPEFVRLLCSRAIERSKRLEVVDTTFRDRAHIYIVNFMKLLVQKERFDCFADCVKWFHQRFNDEFGIVEANVTTAIALSDNDKEALRQRLGKISGRKVRLLCRVDPSVIGGVRVEMDGRRYDNTIQDRLGRLRRSLTGSL